MQITADLVRTAHADAWQVEAGIRRSLGGDAATVAGARLSATGLGHAQWNGGDVHDPAAVDIEEIRAWYAVRRVPWGLRLPEGAHWGHGRRILTRPLMGLTATAFEARPAVSGLVLRAATVDDVDDVLAVDSAAFGSDPVDELPWTLPHLGSAEVDAVLALVDDVPVATAYAVRSEGLAGAAALLGGVGVLPSVEGRGIGSAVTAWLVGRAFDSGVALVHLQAETERASAVYERLGFVTVDGFDIYADVTDPA